MDPFVALVHIAQLIFELIKYIAKQIVRVVRAIGHLTRCVIFQIADFVEFKVKPVVYRTFALAVGSLVWLNTQIAQTFSFVHHLLTPAAKLIFELIVFISDVIIKLVAAIDYLLIRPASSVFEFIKYPFVPVRFGPLAQAIAFVRREEATKQAKWIKAASIDGSSCSKFHRVVVCDFDKCDDPFCATYPSIVYFVEQIPDVRDEPYEHGTLVLWRGSLATGIWKVIHRKRYKLYMYSCNVQNCYISRGVISIVFPERLLFIFDTQYGKSKTFVMEYPIHFSEDTVCILCVGRLAANGIIDGWTMRIISTDYMLYNNDDQQGFDWENFTSRGTLVNQLCEFRLNGIRKSVKKQEVIFGDPVDNTYPRLKHVRTSGGLFGAIAPDPQTSTGRALVYDPMVTNGYLWLIHWKSLLQNDHAFSAFNANPTPARGEYFSPMFPVFLNDRACIQCPNVQHGRAEVFLMELAPSTLKFLAVRSLFQARPEWREQMTAEQFTAMTGIRGVEAHFR